MKRVLLALLILSVGTTVFCALRHASATTQSELAAQTMAWQTQTQHLAELRLEQQHLSERRHELEQQQALLPPPSALTQLAEKILSGTPWASLSATECERLLAELGFSWNTTGDYLIISKKSLAGISFGAVQKAKLTEAALKALAITPSEQAGLESLTKQQATERTAWVKEHVQREEPSGLVVAKYTLPLNPELSQSQHSAFTNHIMATLGAERGDLFRDKAWGWMESQGMLSGPQSAYANTATSLSVKRYAADRTDLGYTLQQGNSMMSASVLPWQSFPEAFRSVFPGGWQELAEREGFELPKEFKKATGR